MTDTDAGNFVGQEIKEKERSSIKKHVDRAEVLFDKQKNGVQGVRVGNYLLFCFV